MMAWQEKACSMRRLNLLSPNFKFPANGRNARTGPINLTAVVLIACCPLGKHFANYFTAGEKKERWRDGVRERNIDRKQ